MIPKELLNAKPLTGDESLPRDADYLGAIDFVGNTEPVLTISQLFNTEITLSQGREKKKVITFVEDRVPGINEVRPLVLNRTNWKTLKKLFGDMTAATLSGKKIQLYLQNGVRIPGTKEVGKGIRIREKIPDGKAYEAPKCEACGKAIVGTASFTPEQLVAASKQKYGRGLCIECGKKAKAELEAKQAEEVNMAKAAEAKAEAKAESDTKAVNVAEDLAAQLMATAMK